MATVEILIKGKNAADPAIDSATKGVTKLGKEGEKAGEKLTKSFDGFRKTSANLTESLLAVNAAMDIAGKVVNGLQKAYEAVISPTIEFANSVYDLGLITGASAEETSKLVQAADDAFVSFETLRTAAVMASRQGISLTIDSIAELSDQYLKLAPGAERTSFLLEKFGRSGADMAPLLDKGSAAIRAMGDEADKLGITMSGKNVQAAKEFQEAMGNFNDRLDATKFKIGNDLIPVLTQALDAQNAWTDQLNNSTIPGWVKAIPVIGTAIGAIENGVFTIQNLAQAEEVAAAGTNSLRAANEMLSPSMDGVGEASSNLLTDLSPITAKFGELTAAMIFNKAAANLDADAALKLAGSLGLINEDTAIALDSLDMLREKYDTNGDGAITASEKTSEYIDAVKRLAAAMGQIPTEKNVNINVNTNYSSSGDSSTYYPGESQEDDGFATGGVMSPGFALVGERGPEIIQTDKTARIYTADQTAGMIGGGNGITINVSGNLVVPSMARQDILSAAGNVRV